jgi:hypothetical protein
MYVCITIIDTIITLIDTIITIIDTIITIIDTIIDTIIHHILHIYTNDAYYYVLFALFAYLCMTLDSMMGSSVMASIVGRLMPCRYIYMCVCVCVCVCVRGVVACVYVC